MFDETNGQGNGGVNLNKPEEQQNETQNQYGQQNGYDQQNPYGQQNGYNQQNPYGQQNGYNQQNQYGQQNSYSQTDNGYTYAQGYEQPRSDGGIGFGIAALVLGILALVTFCTGCINLPLAILSIIFAIIQLVKGDGKGLAIGGIITSVFSVLACVIIFVVWGANLAKFAEEYDVNEMMEFYENIYGEDFFEDNYENYLNDTF